MGRDWNSPEELAKDGAIFLKMMHVIAGIYYWEFVTSLNFEWKFITGKKRFHWPMIFYFGARYCMLTTLTGILIALSVTTPINCGALYTVVGTTGQATSGFTSLILGVRTMVIWEMRWYVVVPIVLVSLGQWAVVLQGGIFTGQWIPGTGCLFVATHHKAQIITWIYSLVFDFIITALATYKLVIWNPRRTAVTKILFNDGLIYYLVALTANIPAIVMMELNLNPVLGVMLNAPASMLFTIVACRAVRHLANFQSTKPEMYTPASLPSSNNSQSRYTGGIRSADSQTPLKISNIRLPRDAKTEVHVQMDTLRVGDIESTNYVDITQSLEVKDAGTL